MKKYLLTFILAIIAMCGFTCAAADFTEVVYLKNGSVIKGLIVEQIPNKTITIKTENGSLIICNYDEVLRITKEENRLSYNSNGDIDTYELHGWEKSPRYRGFVGDTYTIGIGDWAYDRNLLWTSHGCQILPYLYAGIGLGANYFVDSETWTLPIFAHVRGEIHNVIRRNFSPYLDIKGGYNVLDVEGGYFSVESGIHFYFGHSITGISIGVGYNLMTYNDSFHGYYPGYYSSYSTTNILDGIHFSVAFDF